MSADTDPTRSAAADAVAAPLDLLLTDAATGMLRRVNPGGSGLRLAVALAARPRLLAGRGTRLAGELARIAVGRSQVQPSRRDRRFADPGWASNPLLRRAMQAKAAARARHRRRGHQGTADVIRHRLQVFAETTGPLVPYYTERGILIAVDADQPPETVTADIQARLAGLTRVAGR
jgi:hypothetical protein